MDCIEVQLYVVEVNFRVNTIRFDRERSRADVAESLNKAYRLNFR